MACLIRLQPSFTIVRLLTQHSLLSDEGGQTVPLYVHVDLMRAAVLLGTPCSKPAVVAKMKELNVQLDNLCQVPRTGGR